MAWKDQLRRASFRKVEFYVDSADGTFGRRVVVHEFPRKVLPYAEDMGQKVREFTLDAFVVGEDYFSQRDALLGALNTEGPGELVHPYLGRLYAVCTEVTVREATRDGGLARFSIKFVETGDPTAPVPKVDAKSELVGVKASVISKAKAYMAAAWSTVGYATHVADKAVAATESVLHQVETAQKRVRGALSEVAELSFKVRKIRANVRKVVAAPEELATEIDDTFGMLTAALEGGEGGSSEASKYLKALFVINPTLSAMTANPSTIPSQTQIRENANALATYTQVLAVAYQAETLANRDFDSAQDAARERNQTLEALDGAMESVDDDTYAALKSLRVAITRAVPAPDKTLAQEVEVYVPRTTSSLVLAYETFDSIESESDIIARNGLQHPGFIPAGGKLKAIND